MCLGAQAFLPRSMKNGEEVCFASQPTPFFQPRRRESGPVAGPTARFRRAMPKPAETALARPAAAVPDETIGRF